MIEAGKKVSMSYTLNVDGEVVDSSKGEPFSYIHGENKIIPGLERQLSGLKVGDEKTIVVEADEAYGQPAEDAKKDIPLAQLPEGMEPQAGQAVEVGTPGGEKKIARIDSVNEESIVLDFNHPLAGKQLKFEVKITDVS